MKSLFLFLIPLLLWSQNSERNLSLENWKFQKKGDSNLLQATVPGTVHTDLLANKIIPDPFLGTNEKQLQWIENEDWEYETTFSLSESELKNQNIDLIFEGLDTYATVFLNGKLLLETDNMFRTWNTSVKNKLQKGENHLKIVFKSAVNFGKEEAKKLPYVLPGDEKVFTRKAQYQYGWDWGPRFVTAGIYRPIKLHFWNNLKIETIRYEQNSLTDELAKLNFIITLNCQKDGDYNLKINDETSRFNLKKGINKIQFPFEILNPKRWWTNGLGEANLYSFQINVLENDKIVDSKKLNIGLRTIELIQEKDKIGTSFYIKLNGIPVFMKGANYIPPDSFLPRVSDSVYKNIVKNAVDVNMNMLRVWGGGVYAEDIFYDECDKNGILVWQDFMFACAMFPGDEKFIENVKNEVIDNVNRLQNHASIALWCGNNESDEGWKNWGWQKQYKYSVQDSTKIWNDYGRLFHDVIPKTLDSLLSKEKNIYWPSSPSIGWGKKESLLQGDSHYWGIWWGKEPFENYERKVGRFMSEYGFQGMPNLKTFKKFASNEELNLTSESVKSHQKHGTGYETINEYMVRDYNVPKLFEDYIYVSQLLQADGMKTAIEAHRRAKPNCMGTLYWQLNDCWPVTSWSSVDYFGNWKALHYQVRKSFENLLISVDEDELNYKIYLVNDSLENFGGNFYFDLLDFNGNKLWSSNVVAVVPANSSLIHFEISKKAFEAFNLKEVLLSVHFNSQDKIVNSLYYFVKPKDLKLTKPSIKINKIDDVTIEVSSDVLAKNVYLSSDENTFFSDNYFDVLPNEKVIVKLSKPVKNIVVKSLFDTLK
ncbi:beta-mannosidase [Flavobacterium aquatile]|uniref:Beta-mannosidase B n=2 Tax=Flavobacterium aquatile TaxID=245 RepID=A0A095SYD7_9FLAO|nr:beta-mannosidase [Flavobacterium aquatile LMG 4008 = ATCC 11947]OXA66236.1 beta-mannosidase [Flavobacterium aquatile] [Flavobacterium aquatile LMG 4008 = ATCC 11947]